MRHFLSFDRGIIVAASFLLWLGAAGLICWALVPAAVQDEPGGDPAAIVHTAKIAATAMPVSLAQR